MKLTKQEAIDLHRQKWLWIAEETEKQQRIVKAKEYFETAGLEEPLLYSYCCEFAKNRPRGRVCDNCPIQWPHSYNNETAPDSPCLNSYYYQWSHARKWERASVLARKIANLKILGETINA